jgi:hypothetical protein|mmetsp:Transcript_68073/g.107997  ORF Transcript_68073/g.107997 Transcript_68073/m.107997 type:complete len:224 (-) Transcript_68073:227-898(-)
MTIAMAPPDRLADIKKCLCIMQDFNWTFPANPSTGDFDEATNAFSTFSRAVSHLRPEDNLASALSAVSAEWSQVLAFLSSMYRFKARASFRRLIVDCLYNMWRIDVEFREILEREARHSPEKRRESQDSMPWLGDDEWRAVFQAELVADISARREIEASSASLIREIAPLFDGRWADMILGPAEKCFRCGQKQGFLFSRKGFGWRQRTHDARCRNRMCERRSS